MRFCQDHWDKLKDAVDARGLSAFVADDGSAVIDRVVAESESGPSKTTFEPLMAAHMAIVSNVLRIAGLEAMANNEDGTDRCPLCFIIAGCNCGQGDACPFLTFIDRAADDQLEAAKSLGLVGTT